MAKKRAEEFKQGLLRLVIRPRALTQLSASRGFTA
ncbi:hypothetical protein EV656_1062 [Rhodovulum adriaticum]|uniref:Uncharacterized protein n=1 Tax=Rhodovulum adriaticum TaxID=35804 RepID=A0A4V2SL86_RHOAD|nr:hypothetical protein EV656_1062 [Rhodovulum adriaticum]